MVDIRKSKTIFPLVLNNLGTKSKMKDLYSKHKQLILAGNMVKSNSWIYYGSAKLKIVTLSINGSCFLKLFHFNGTTVCIVFPQVETRTSHEKQRVPLPIKRRIRKNKKH